MMINGFPNDDHPERAGKRSYANTAERRAATARRQRRWRQKAPRAIRFRGRYWRLSGHAPLHRICLLLIQSGHGQCGARVDLHQLVCETGSPFYRRVNPLGSDPMKYTIPLSICVGILGSQIVVAAEGEIPKFDIAAACRTSGSVQTPAKCMQDEQAAHDLLVKQWPQFKQSDTSRCIQITTSRAASANYSELLTCLQAATIQKTDPFGPTPKLMK
jgi:hypothetical protein